MSGAKPARASATMQQTWSALSSARVIWSHYSPSPFLESLRLLRNNLLPRLALEEPEPRNRESIWFFHLRMRELLHEWIGSARASRS